MAFADFVTDTEILEFFSTVKDGFVVTDIPTLMRENVVEIIKFRSDNDWDKKTAAVLFIDGRQNNTVFTQIVPINFISDIIVIGKDETQTKLTFQGADKQVWFDEETGKIEIIRFNRGIEFGTKISDEPSVFPEGVNNVKIVGAFGDTTPATIKQLELLLLLKSMKFKDATNFKAQDIVRERIGKYEYELFGKSTTRAGSRSLDDWIDFLFELLPETQSIGLEAI